MGRGLESRTTYSSGGSPVSYLCARSRDAHRSTETGIEAHRGGRVVAGRGPGPGPGAPGALRRARKRLNRAPHLRPGTSRRAPGNVGLRRQHAEEGRSSHSTGPELLFRVRTAPPPSATVSPKLRADPPTRTTSFAEGLPPPFARRSGARRGLRWDSFPVALWLPKGERGVGHCGRRSPPKLPADPCRSAPRALGVTAKGGVRRKGLRLGPWSARAESEAGCEGGPAVRALPFAGAGRGEAGDALRVGRLG